MLEFRLLTGLRTKSPLNSCRPTLNFSRRELCGFKLPDNALRYQPDNFTLAGPKQSRRLDLSDLNFPVGLEIASLLSYPQ